MLDPKSKINAKFIKDRFKEIPENLEIKEGFCCVLLPRSKYNNTLYVCETRERGPKSSYCQYVFFDSKENPLVASYSYRLDMHPSLYPVAYLEIGFFEILKKELIKKKYETN